MKKNVVLLTMCIALMGATSAVAAQIELWNYEFNVNGFLTNNDDGTRPVPTGLNASAFDWSTGLGTLTLTFNPGAAGTYGVAAWFDHDIYNYDGDGAYEDETAASFGSLPDPNDNGQFGTAYSDFGFDGASMQIGYNNIGLAVGELAVITFTISTDDPGGFGVHQIQEAYRLASGFDQDRADLYLTSSLDIRAVPEPATMLLFASGLAGLAGFSRKRRK